MKTVKSTFLSGLTRRIGVGMTALALAVTFSLPTAALAKQKKTSPKVSKVSVEKKVSKKLSKKSSKPKTVAKHTKSAVKSPPKVASTVKAKATKKTVASKHRQAIRTVAHKQTTPHKRTSSKKTTKKQAYYVMPDALGGEVGKPQQQPDYLNTAATPAKSGKIHQVGTASYYSDKFDGGKTASGERFDQDGLTCAHGSLPFGCRIRVTNLRNNKAVEVKVNDRGGFAKHGRVIDLSKAAAKEIGMMGTGTAKVKVEVLE